LNQYIIIHRPASTKVLWTKRSESSATGYSRQRERVRVDLRALPELPEGYQWVVYPTKPIGPAKSGLGGYPGSPDAVWAIPPAPVEGHQGIVATQVVTIIRTVVPV
jgi:hypothetical protein